MAFYNLILQILSLVCGLKAPKHRPIFKNKFYNLLHTVGSLALGSVIAYDTLCELLGEGTVDLFVTLGSPLGNRYVKERLLSHRGSRLPRYPTSIRHWRNLSALGEMTSLERSMSEEFADMRRQGLIQSLEDRVDLVNPFVGPEGLNVHRCYGYFVNEVTGATIAEWWHGAFDAPGAAPRAVQ